MVVPIFILPLLVFLYLFKKTQKKLVLLFVERSGIEEGVNTLNDTLIHQERLRGALNKKINRYSYLKELTQNLSLELSLDGVWQILRKAITEVFGDYQLNCLLYLVDRKKHELSLVYSMSTQNEIIKTKKGNIFDYWVIKKTQPLLVENVKTDFRFDLDIIEKEEARAIGSLAAAPLIAHSRPIGVLHLDSADIAKFNSDDVRLLSTIADLLTVAVENALFYEHTKELSIKDGLTGLYLRRFFMERLHEELDRARLNRSSVSLFMLDIDNFKKYNDKFGHIAGDIVLKVISAILLKTCTGSGTVISRYGGEEFIILIPNFPKKEAFTFANTISHNIKSTDIVLRRNKTNVTVSIGIATFPSDTKIEEDLIRKADFAMYQAKQMGRNRVCSC
ncbi:MAG: sensor domain-containing diguanylate cyclase [Candidatus Omnitrophota bacterium]